jgi:DNA-binding transcriptional LysR family regulator
MQRTARLERLHWDDVRLFLALCRSQTLGGAAKVLELDASTVSRRLVSLEEALATSLFDRGRDGVAPTKAAEDLMPVAEEIEDGFGRFTHAVGALEREVAGTVRVACPPDLAEVVLAPLLPALLSKHPLLRVLIDPGEGIVDLSRREADLALRTVRPQRGDLIVTRVLSASWVLAGTPKLLKKLGALRAWEDAPWVGWGERLAHVPAARWLSDHVKGYQPRLRSDSLMVQLAVVRAGGGVALVPQPSLDHYGLAQVKLAPALRAAAASWPVDELYLVSHRALRHVPRVRVVWDLLVAQLAKREKRG